MAATVWYFAYGSNMNRAQITSRAGEIVEEQPGKLENFELLFNKKARGGAATANIRPAPGKRVLGVLYKIPESALRSLDRYEGVPTHYRRVEVSVTDGHGAKIAAQAYIATKVERSPLAPEAHYLKAILDGADQHGLPKEYIAEIKKAAGTAGASRS